MNHFTNTSIDWRSLLIGAAAGCALGAWLIGPVAASSIWYWLLYLFGGPLLAGLAAGGIDAGGQAICAGGDWNKVNAGHSWRAAGVAASVAYAASLIGIGFSLTKEAVQVGSGVGVAVVGGVATGVNDATAGGSACPGESKPAPSCIRLEPLNPVLRLTSGAVVFALAALIGAGGGVFFLALAKHALDAQAAYRSAAACSASEALGGRNCIAATSGTVSRKYTDGAFPAANVNVPEAGRVVTATFRNSSSGKSAWSKLPTGTVVPVSLWRGFVIQVDGVATIDHPDQLQNTGVAPWGVLMIVGSLGGGIFAVYAILLERKRYLALRPQ